MDRFPSLPHSGPAKVVWFVGLMVALVGGAIFGFGVISFMADVWRALGAEEPATPDMDPMIRGLTVGFPLFAAGAVVAGLASVLSPPPPEPRMAFHGPSQVVASGRDTHIRAGQVFAPQYTVYHARADVQTLREALAWLRLPPDAKEQADRSLESAQRELGKPGADFRTVADRLKHVTTILDRFGALYRAGESVIDPLRRLAAFLAPLGERIL